MSSGFSRRARGISRVLVTGGAGFIGSWLVERLVEGGHKVYVVDNFTSGSLENIKSVANRIKLVKADLRESAWIRELEEVDVVFHMAASPRVERLDNRAYFDNNILSAFNALEFARRSNVEMFVYASSGAVYGNADVVPTPEGSPYSPVDMYGASKASGEVLCKTYAKLYGIRCLILRYSDVVGPRARNCPVYRTAKILAEDPNAVVKIARAADSLRSYLHVEDVVRATLLAWERFEEASDPVEVYNVGNLDALTMEEVVRTIGEVIGVRPRVYYTGVDRIKVIHMSIDKIMSKVGWRPSLNSRESVRKAVVDALRARNAKYSGL